MTKYRFNGLGGEKLGIFPLTFCTTTYYTTNLSQNRLITNQNPMPSSFRANLKYLENTNSVSPKAGFTRIGYASQSMITRNPKAPFKGKSKRDRAFGGESESLPRLMRRGFERDQTTLPLASEIGIKMPFKACDNEALGDIVINRMVEKGSAVNEVMTMTYKKVERKRLKAMCLCYKGLGDNRMINNHREEFKMQY